MAMKQVASSVQNDGNWCYLDVRDEEYDGPLMRIETYRCSQPSGGFGITKSGTRVEHLAGTDHLTSESNRILRHAFSVEDENKNQKVTLEIREIYDESGAWEVRTRDLDPDSKSFGYVLVINANPEKDDTYRLRYEIRKPQVRMPEVLVTSPLSDRITELVPGFADIGAPVDQLGVVDTSISANPFDVALDWRLGSEHNTSVFEAFASNFQREPLAQWAKNVQTYLYFGDYRDKGIHPGDNIVGEHRQLAVESMLIRGYRSSMIMLGKVCDPDMSKGVMSFWDAKDPLAVYTKPGVYSVFLSAYILNYGIYQLSIDKVHSDYGGIPMKLAPGSKMETGISPIVDSRRANITLAELAMAFYNSASTVAKQLTVEKEFAQR